MTTPDLPNVAGSVADLYAEVASEWDFDLNVGLTPEVATPGSKRKVGWICKKCQHKWEARINSRTRGGYGCPECGRRTAGKAKSTPRPGESLADKLPEVAAEWHPTRNGDLTPSDVGYASNKKVWWLCRSLRNVRLSPRNGTQPSTVT